MSAFEVNETHIDILISAALQHNHYGPLGWYHQINPEERDAERREITQENAEEWGAILLAENRRSVNYRYSEDEFEAPYILTRYVGPFDPVAVIKAIHCYRYQSCEHPGWETSEAYDFCVALTERMTHELPGYDEAPWEVTDPSSVMKGGVTATPVRRYRR